MEVDRVSQMNGVGRDNVPSWPKTANRRRKFVENIEDPESEAGAEASEQEESAEKQPADQDNDRGGALNVIA